MSTVTESNLSFSQPPNFSALAPAAPDDIQQFLKHALRIPAANRMVSDFLFTGLIESPFHHDYVLPPSAMATSVAIRVEENVLGPPDIGKPFKELGFTFNPDFMNTNDPFKVIFDSLYIPVCYAYPYALGYSFNTQALQVDSLCLENTPFETPCIARFVFDTRTGDLLKVSHGGKPQAIGIHSMRNLIKDGVSHSWDHEACIVPAVPYEWPYLPTTVLWKISSNVVRNHQTSPPAPPVPSDQLVSDLTPWPLRHDGSWADGSIPSRHSNSSSSIFAVAALRKVIQALSLHLSGEFEAPGIRFDVLKSMAPKQMFDSARSESKFGRINFIPASTACTVRLREHFSAAYYIAALTPSSDTRLLIPSPRIRDGARETVPMESADSLLGIFLGRSDKLGAPHKTEECLHESESSFDTTSGNVTNASEVSISEPTECPASSALDLNLDVDGDAVTDGFLGPNLSQDGNLDATFAGNDILEDILEWLPPSSLPLSTYSAEDTKNDRQVNDFFSAHSDWQSDKSDAPSSSTSVGKNSSSESFTMPIDDKTSLVTEEVPVVDEITAKSYLMTSISRGTVTEICSTVVQSQNSSAESASQPIRKKPIPIQPLIQPRLPELPLPIPQLQSQPGRGRKDKQAGSKTSEQSRKEMLEARRRRNRISAAKSNERKRLMLEQLKRDMETQKRRATELKQWEERALVENQRLKAMLINKQRECAT